MLALLSYGCAPANEPPVGKKTESRPADSAQQYGNEKTDEKHVIVKKEPTVAPLQGTANGIAAGEGDTRAGEFKRLPPPEARIFSGLEQVSEDCDVWFDKDKKRVVMQGGVCLREGPLELFACIHRWIDDSSAPGTKVRRGTKEYESIVTVNTSAAVVHSALLLAGAKPGHPVRFEPKYEPASGTPIDVTVYWKDEAGNHHEVRAQDWIQNFRSKEHMKEGWVFAGSTFLVDEKGNKQQYQGENGNLICVSNFPDALLDVPVQSTASNDALSYVAYTEHIPPLGTTVTIVLTPKAEE